MDSLIAKRLVTPTGCWEWRAGRYSGGYGGASVNGRSVKVHRLAWELTNGAIPDGMFVLHRCDNPPCFNPDHLFVGTPKDNVADMDAKGRRRFATGERSHLAKISDAAADSIRSRYANGERGMDLAAEFGVSKALVSMIVNNKTRRFAS